ncbi:MAG TPA: prepilin peptidase [Bryobacteraceae bacterium]|nr:prepilin peptidase [Bryobacteraceae bacterium]
MIAFSLIAFLYGLVIGSFLNVCIYRLPRDLSVIKPRSFCPGCQKQIAWYDNIPVLSFFLLGRKCRYCGTPISFRYALVELLTGLLFFLIVLALGPTAVAFKLCVLCALLVGLTFTDLDSLILPDELTLGGTVVGLLFAWFVPVDDMVARLALSIAGFHPSPHWASLAESLAGAVLPAGFLGLGGWVFEKIRHKEGLGLGDVKMMAMVGAFLGLRAALLTLVVGSIAGSVVGLIYIYATKKDASTYELPFGAFLGFAGILVALTGAPVIHWYWGLL